MRKRLGDIFCTSDLFEATYLSYKGFKFTINKDNPRSALFIFKDSEKNMLIESLLKEFWSGSDAEKLLTEFKNIKKRAVFDNYKKNYHDSNRKNGSNTSNQRERTNVSGQSKASNQDENRGKGETTS